MIFLNQANQTMTPNAPVPRPLAAEPFPSASSGTTGGQKLETLVRGMTRTIHMQDTPLSALFFSAPNVDEVQRRLRDIIRKETGYTIQRQSDDAILVAMRHVYIRDAANLPDAAREVTHLNSAVLAEIVPMVASGLMQYLAYVRDASRLPQSLPRPQQASIKGSRSTELFRAL